MDEVSEEKLKFRVLSRHMFIQWLASINELDEWMELTNRYTDNLMSIYLGEPDVDWESTSSELANSYGVDLISHAFLQDEDLTMVAMNKWELLADTWGKIHLEIQEIYNART